MTSIEVLVRGSLIGTTVTVHPLLTKDTVHSRISKSLAKKLGLLSDEISKPVYVSSSSPSSEALKWKISLLPIKVLCRRNLELKSISLYPIINCSSKDAFYEMILGQDSYNLLPDIETYTFSKYDCSSPTPGPAFNSIALHTFSVELFFTDYSALPRVNEFLEYSCNQSTAVERMALNKVTRQLAVVYRGNDTVYVYAGVTKTCENAFECTVSFGKTLAVVRDQCSCGVIESFPDTILVKPDLYFRFW